MATHTIVYYFLLAEGYNYFTQTFKSSYNMRHSMSKNIFEQAKEQLVLTEVIGHYLGQNIVNCGTNTFQLEDKTCPACHHEDCFKIHDLAEDSYYKCFSCGATGDVISFTKEFFELEKMDDAVAQLEKDFKITVKRAKSTMTEIESLLISAADYYSECLFSSQDIITIDSISYTPLEYQLKYRNHYENSLRDFKVGYSDGGLTEYLTSIGIIESVIMASGLGMRDTKGNLYDFFSRGLFIYPHNTLHRVSNFSQKDPRKQLAYQFPSKFRLNNCMFYGQETVAGTDKVIVVEGQNDRISILEAGFDGAVLATCGSISAKQLEWMKENLAGKTVITSFDSDDAGAIYRKKLEKILPVSHIRFPPNICKDIDQFLKKVNPDLSEAFSFIERAAQKEVSPLAAIEEAPAETSSISVPKYDKELGIVEKSGSYYTIKTDKEGKEVFTRLTDFTIKLKNIFLVEGKRIREADIIRCDSPRAKSILVDSETKVSIKFFRSKIADACDATFFGQENDLLNMWRYVYKNNAEKTVYLPDHIGKVDLDGGWLFGNVYIKPDGEVIEPDATGVMWLNGNLTGIRPLSISEDLDADVYSKGSRNIPKLNYTLVSEEVKHIEKSLVQNYAKNLGNVGNALMILGWAKLSAFSNRLFQTFGFTPFMFLWGDKGVGKTSLIHWILGIYSMKTSGYDTLANLRSGVGFERKLGYYSSLPVCLDELRASKEMVEFTGRFRAWYNRSGRSMAGQGTKKIVQQQVRSNFLFGGQDMFNDDALRERCVVIRIPKEGRELKESYQAICKLEANNSLSAIGFKWIREAQECDYEEIIDDIERITNRLLEQGCKQRTARVWACIAHFSQGLSDEYFPDFDFESFLVKTCGEDVLVQADSGFLNRFFELLDGIYAMANSPLTADHLRVEGNELYIWFIDAWRICTGMRRDNTEEQFSRDAVRTALKEEPYYVTDTSRRMGVGRGTVRRVMVFDITDENLPDSLRSIAEALQDRK